MIKEKDVNWSELVQFVQDMKATSKKLEKIEIIKRFKDRDRTYDVVQWCYDPFVVYNVTSKQCLKKCDEEWIHGETLESLLTGLKNRVWTGNAAIAMCNGYARRLDDDARNVFWSILDRNMEVRASASTFNSVSPGWVPEFKPALANVWEPKLTDWGADAWLASRKLDGVRCLAIINEEGEVTLRSRQGQEFLTLAKIQSAIEAMNLTNVVLDGEVCLVDENDDEDFHALMKEIRRKDHTIANPVFKIFDMIPHDKFWGGYCDTPLVDRLASARTFVADANKNGHDCLNYVEHIQITNEEHYYGKRSNFLLKVKTFYDEEYVVKNCDSREHRIIRDGKEIKVPMLSQVYIEHKGYEVAVGSGFSHAEREHYHANPQDIIGKVITVQYFEETKNQDGEWSLRFPVVKTIHGDARTT